MRHVRSILRHHFGEGYSIRKTAEYSRVSFSTARDYIQRAKQAGLSCSLPAGITNAELKERLLPPPVRALVIILRRLDRGVRDAFWQGADAAVDSRTLLPGDGASGLL